MGLLQSAITIGIMSAALAFVISIIPSYALSDDFIDAIVMIVTYIEPWGYLVNFQALLNATIFVTVFEAIYFGIRVAIWVMDEIFNRA